MQQTLRPYITTGLAVIGVSLIAVEPVSYRSDLQQVRHVVVAEASDIALTAGGGILAPYVDLFTNTAGNLQALAQNSVNVVDLLEYVFTHPQQALAGIPDVVNIFTNVLPSIDTHVLPFPADIDLQLPVWGSSLLGAIGPWATLFNAIPPLLQEIFNFSDPIGALSALIGAPATLLDAFLNGHGNFDAAGMSIPLFNGLLTPVRSLGAHVDIASLIDASGLGTKTLTGLLSQAGIGDVPVESLIVSLLDQAGLGHMTPVDLLNEYGIGQEKVSALLIDALNQAGIGNPSIAQLLAQLGGISPDDSVASLLIALLNLPQVGVGNPTVSELILSLVGGDDQSVGGLIKDLLGPTGSQSLASFVDPTLTVGGVVTELMGDPAITEVLAQLGLGDITVGSLPGMLGDIGNEHLVDLINNGLLGPDITGSTGLLALLSSAFPPGATFEDLLGPMGSVTLGQLLATTPAGPEYPGMMLADIKFTDLTAMAGFGDTPLAELAPDQAALINLIGNPTLNALLGTNTVGQTLNNLGLSNATVSELLQSTGLSNYQLETLFEGLGNLSGNVKLGDFLNDLGFNPTISELLTRAIDGLGLQDTTLLALLQDWGLGSIGLSSLLDSLGLDDLHIAPILNNLGLNNISVDSFIDRLGLSGVPIAHVLSGLGLDDRHIDDVITSLLGSVSIGSVMGGLGLDEVHLDSFLTDVMTSVLGDPSLASLLTDIGLNNNDLDTIVANLGIGGVTINSLLTDLGLGTTDLDTIVHGLGLSDLGLLDVHSDFFGLIPEWLNDIPQQIAEALGYTA